MTSLYLAFLHEPDDLGVELVLAIVRHVLADRVAPQIELLRERFVDDRDLCRPAHRVGRGELASGTQRDSERVEEARVLISLKRASVSVSGSFLKPSTDARLPQLLPASSGTRDAVTPVTPGSAAIASSARVNSTAERSGL